MEGDDLRRISEESDAFAAALRPDALDRRVPGCPDWTLRELAWHLGRVQRFWADDVRAGADVEPSFSDEAAPGPSEPGELAEWMRASTGDLIDALGAAAPDAPAWSWWKEQHTAGAIARHQVQEAAVHRWDAQSVLGSPDPLPVPIADDGVDEFLWVARQFREPVPIALSATDTGRTFSLAPGAAAVTVSATASDLVLLLYGRVSPDDVGVEGDRAVLDAFLMPIG